MSSQESSQFYHAHDIKGLPLLSACYKQQNFSRHVHEEYCIGVIDQGAQRFFRSGANHIAAQNSIILVNPDQVHDGHSATDSGWKYRAIYPMPCLIKSVQDELSPRDTGMAMFSEPVVNDPLLANQLRYFFNLLQHSDNSLERESTFMSVLSALLQRHASGRFQPKVFAVNIPAIRIVKDYLDNHFIDNISIQTLATLVNLNPFYLTRLFQKHLGLPPHAYQIQRRLFHAKKMLLAGNTLLDTALASGFSDQSHLNQHFKKWLGVPPGKYQRNIHTKNRN